MDIKQCIHWLENVQHIKIVNWGKQAKALTQLEKAGYNGKQVADCYWKMKEDRFWADKTIDYMNIANNIHRFIKTSEVEDLTPFQKECRRNKEMMEKAMKDYDSEHK